jgi:hypothetical protein
VAPDVLPLAPVDAPVVAPVDAPVVAPLVAPVVAPLAGGEVPDVAVPELEPLAGVVPDVAGVEPELVPVPTVVPLPTVVPEPEPLVGSVLSPEGSVCGGFGEPVEQPVTARNSQAAVELRTLNLEVIALSSS